MKGDVETPAALVDINAPRRSRTIDRAARRRPAHRRAGAQQRRREPSAGAQRAIRCCRRRCWPARRRSCATWRPSAATCCSARAAITSATRPIAQCNKREPGTGCAAREGYNRMHAILGASEQCIATHPSDMCVALAALDAVVHVRGPERRARDPDRRLPRAARRHAGASRRRSRRGELITAVDLPPSPFAARMRTT